ncbi:hypothetical protein P4U23_15035 [Aeribacillus composti]|nr:hypothetical protein [Aeribacillus composti]
MRKQYLILHRLHHFVYDTCHVMFWYEQFNIENYLNLTIVI